MRLDNWLGATTSAKTEERRVATLQVTSIVDRMVVLGSTIPTTVSWGIATHSLTLAQVPGEDTGLIALWLMTDDSRNFGGFVPVDWKAESPIDLNKVWLSRPDRLGQITGRRIDVMTGEKFYTSSLLGIKTRGPQGVYVPDGNLLCRYLAGLADESELEAAIMEVERQKSLEEELRLVRAIAEQTNEDFLKEIDELQRDCVDACMQLGLMRATVQFFYDQYHDLARMIFSGSRFGLRRRLKDFYITQQTDFNEALNRNDICKWRK